MQQEYVVWWVCTTTCLLITHDKIVFFKYLTMNVKTPRDRTICDHRPEPLLSYPTVACAVFAVRQTPQCPEFLTGAGCQPFREDVQELPIWKRAWSLVSDTPESAVLFLWLSALRLKLNRLDGYSSEWRNIWTSSSNINLN